MPRQIFMLTVMLFVLSIVSAQTKRKAVFVIVDGIPADVVEKISTPALDSIAAVGGYARAYVGGERDGYSQTPTISAVGYNSLLTGTWANKHNVWDNSIDSPNYSYPTIFRLFKEQFPDKKTAVFSSWLDNRTKLVGEGVLATGNLKIDYHYDGLELDTVKFPHDNARDFMLRIDESVIDTASAMIRTQAPDLSWVYLEYTDDMGHAHGDSEPFYRAVRLMDRQISRLWAAIRFRQKNYKEDWVIYITTDHGRTAGDGKGHGGQSDRERTTWIVTNDDGLNSYFKSGKAAIVDIMPSLAEHLGVKLAMPVAYEVDGVRLNGRLSASGLKAVLTEGKLDINWEYVDGGGEAVVYITTTNHAGKGKVDEYIEVGRALAESGKIRVDVSAKESDFYKVVVVFRYNVLNRWVVE